MLLIGCFPVFNLFPVMPRMSNLTFNVVKRVSSCSKLYGGDQIFKCRVLKPLFDCVKHFIELIKVVI